MSSDLRKALEAKSDRLNADDLMAGNRVIKITDVRIMLTAPDGKVVVQYEGGAGKPWKPSKGMGRVMAALWGEDEREWVGRSVELFREPTVVFGGDEVGGIQICGMSHIANDATVIVTKNRKQKAKISVRKLPDQVASQKPAATTAAATTTQAETTAAIDTTATMAALKDAAKLGMEKLVIAWKATPPAMKLAINPKGCPHELKDIAAAADIATAAAIQAAADAEKQQPASDQSDDADYF